VNWAFEPTWWDVLEVTGVWLAAIATFIASLVALHLARERNRPRFRLNVSAARVFEDRDAVIALHRGFSRKMRDCYDLPIRIEDANHYRIEILNLGERVVAIGCFYWTHLFVWPDFMYDDIRNNREKFDLPISPEFGHPVGITLPLTERIEPLLKTMHPNRNILFHNSSATLRLNMNTPLGDFSTRPSRSFLQLLQRLRSEKPRTAAIPDNKNRSNTP
jgi:hypothetical protein